VIALPLDATPIDFAYGVHTEVGHTCIGARVNGRLVSLDSRLNSGDTCEILTSTAEDAAPSEEWANFVVSPKAKSKIKQWFSRERMEDLVDTGRDDLVEHMRKHGLPVQRVLSSEVFAQEREAMNYADDVTLFRAIGEGHVSAESMAGRISRLMRDGGFGEQLSVGMRLDAGNTTDQISGVHVEGMSGTIVRLSKCCTPVPGDEIIGFLTADLVVNVHRADCSNAISAASQNIGRMVDVEWAGSVYNATYVAAVEVVAIDRSRLLRDVANALSDEHVNIVSCSTNTGSDRVARMRFEFEFADPSHLQSVLRTIKRIDSVYDAYRVMAGDHPASNVSA
jgi:GTP pyrophosphokinase